MQNKSVAIEQFRKFNFVRGARHLRAQGQGLFDIHDRPNTKITSARKVNFRKCAIDRVVLAKFNSQDVELRICALNQTASKVSSARINCTGPFQFRAGQGERRQVVINAGKS